MSLLRISVKVKRTPVLPLFMPTTAVLVAVRPVRKKSETLSGIIRYGRSTPSKYFSMFVPSAFGPQLLLVFETASMLYLPLLPMP